MKKKITPDLYYQFVGLDILYSRNQHKIEHVKEHVSQLFFTAGSKIRMII
jgi:hypothetical protein